MESQDKPKISHVVAIAFFGCNGSTCLVSNIKVSVFVDVSTTDKGGRHLRFGKQLKVQMKCFFLFPNLKQQRKSERLPFTVS